MKNLYYSFMGAATMLVLSLSTNQAHAIIVNIPDANFKAALVSNSAINTNLDTEIQDTEAAAFAGTLDVSNLLISDLTGIEAFTAMIGLDCANNNITSLDLT